MPTVTYSAVKLKYHVELIFYNNYLHFFSIKALALILAANDVSVDVYVIKFANEATEVEFEWIICVTLPTMERLSHNSL